MSAWASVMVMHERAGRSDIFKRRSRERYGWARRRFGRWCTETRVGDKNPNHKDDLIDLKHKDGRALSLTRSAWRAEQGIEHAALCGVISGKVQSYRGWMLPETSPLDTGRAYAGRQKRIKTQYHWRHLDGREAIMSPFNFAETYGLSANSVTSVVRGQHAICFGWSIVGRESGWPCGRKYFRDDRIHVLARVDGREVAGTQIELICRTQLDQREISALVTGHRRSCAGWMLREVAKTGYRPRSTRRASQE